MSEHFEVTAIGYVRNTRTTPEDDGWGAIESRIELDPDQLGADALAGLEGFSHVEVVYRFHLADPDAVHRGARRPRGRVDWPEVGILAQRGKDRPNHIGVTVCALIAVDGTSLRVRGLDAIDGTPVLDVKPYLGGFAPRGEVHEPSWATEIMREYW